MLYDFPKSTHVESKTKGIPLNNSFVYLILLSTCMLIQRLYNHTNTEQPQATQVCI